MIRKTGLKKTGIDMYSKTARILAIVLAVLLVVNQSMLVFAADERSDNAEPSVTFQENNDEAETDSADYFVDQTDDNVSEEKPEAEGSGTGQGDDQGEEDNEDGAADAVSRKEKDKARTVLQNTEPGVKLSGDKESSDEDEEIDNETDTITVRLLIKNETYPKSKGAPWEGTLIDTEVTVPSDYSMMQALHRVCQGNNITSTGTDGTYLSMIGGLREFDGGGGSGWMGLINDWMVNQGFASMPIENGDVISLEYTCSLGEDLGASFTNHDKRLKSITTSKGTISPEFDSNFNEYNLVVPEGTKELAVYTTAMNKNYLVKSIVKGQEYNRGAAIPVGDGTRINVKCGDYSWPSMNSYEQEDTVRPVTYRINVYEGNPRFLVDVTGEKCVPELDRDNGIYAAGEKVTVNVRYNKTKYQLLEDSVRAYVGGSDKYIRLDKESGDSYSFTMPGNDIEVKAECEIRPDYPLSVTGDLTGCAMAPDHTDGRYLKGETVTFTLTPDAGKRIDDSSVRVKGKDSDIVVEVENIAQDQYSFTMPGEDVIIYAEAEDIKPNGLTSYAVRTDYGSVKGGFTETSRTSICSLPEKAVQFDLDLNVDQSEQLYIVRVQDVFGHIASYSEDDLTDNSIGQISVGTRNTALLGKDVVLTVITKNTEGKTAQYTIRIKTKKNTAAADSPDALILPYETTDKPLPYKKTMMTSGVQLYEVDYPTVISDFKAQKASVGLAVFPEYEEEIWDIDIRCKSTEFYFVNDNNGAFSDMRWYYQGNMKVDVGAGKTLDVPVEIDFKLKTGETITRKYLFRITNGRYTKQRIKVLTAEGNPLAPSSFALDGKAVAVGQLEFTDGIFAIDMAPGDHKVITMKKTVDFTVTDDLKRPISSNLITIQTDVHEYIVTLTCPDRNAVLIVTDTAVGRQYKVNGNTITLPPGKYQVKAVNEADHLYSRAQFTVSGYDVNVSVPKPNLMDPEFVVQELNLLEDIQTYDAGDGRLEIYVPNYQSEGIVVTPVLTGRGDEVRIYNGSWNSSTDIIHYYIARSKKDQTTYLKYEVYNKSDRDGGIFTTDEMELYIPAYAGAADEVLWPPDVRTLSLKYGIEDGAVVTSVGSYHEFYSTPKKLHMDIPVYEGAAGVPAEQLAKGKYKICYTMRYSAEKDGEKKNVYTVPYYAGYAFELGNDHECTVFSPTEYIMSEDYMYIYPDISVGVLEYDVAGWYEVTAWFEDQDGNRSGSSTITVFKEKCPPEGYVSISQEKGVYDSVQKAPEYSNVPIVLIVDAYDDGVGLHEKPYSYDYGNTWTDDNTLTLTESTEIRFNSIRVRDALGWTVSGTAWQFDYAMYGIERESGGTHQFNPTFSWFTWPGNSLVKYFYIDLDAPSLVVSASFDDRSSKMTLKVIAEDDTSGLENEAYSFDGGETWQSSNTYTVTLGEYHGDHIQVKDKAGNVAVYDGSVIWTKDSFSGAAPSINNVKVEYGSKHGVGSDGRTWYDSAKIKINASPGASDIAGYSFDGESYQKTSEISIIDPEYIDGGRISVIDKNGNITTYDVPLDLTNVDGAAPDILSGSIGRASAPVREVYAEVEASDMGSGCLQYAISPVPMDKVDMYSSGRLDLEWTSSGRFAISDVIRKYGRDWLQDSYDYLDLGFLFSGPDRASRHTMAVRIWVKDAVGNITYKDLTSNCLLYLDCDGPEISEVTTEYKYFDNASGIVRVYVAATEPKFGSGLAPKAYSFDGGKTWQASNSISIPIGASIPAGQIKVRDVFGNISTYNKVVKTTLQNVIAKINKLDPKTAKDKDYKEIIDLYNQLSDREKAKVYNWQKFLEMMGNRKDQDWDDDFGDIGEPDNGDDHGGDDHGGDDGGNNDSHHDGDDNGGGSDDDGNGGDNGGSGDNDGKPSDGSGNGNGGGSPESADSDGGSDADTVNVALSNASTSSAPDAKAKAGQNYREAEIDKVGGGSMLSRGMVKPWELMLLIIIVLGAYVYGAHKRYRRYREEV